MIAHVILFALQATMLLNPCHAVFGDENSQVRPPDSPFGGQISQPLISIPGSPAPPAPPVPAATTITDPNSIYYSNYPDFWSDPRYSTYYKYYYPQLNIPVAQPQTSVVQSQVVINPAQSFFVRRTPVQIVTHVPVAKFTLKEEGSAGRWTRSVDEIGNDNVHEYSQESRNYMIFRAEVVDKDQKSTVETEIPSDQEKHQDKAAWYAFFERASHQISADSSNEKIEQKSENNSTDSASVDNMTSNKTDANLSEISQEGPIITAEQIRLSDESMLNVRQELHKMLPDLGNIELIQVIATPIKNTKETEKLDETKTVKTNSA